MLGPTPLSSRRHTTTVLAVLGDPSLVGSEIQGEKCREMEMTRKRALSVRQERREDKVCM